MLNIDFIRRYFQRMAENQEVEQTSYELMLLDHYEEIYRFLVSSGVSAKLICEPTALELLTDNISTCLSQTIDGQIVNLQNTISESAGEVTIVFTTSSAENSLTIAHDSITLRRKGTMAFGNPIGDSHNSSQEISRYYIENNSLIHREVFLYNAVQERHKPSIANESYLTVTDQNLSRPSRLNKELAINYISKNTTPEDIENIIKTILQHQDLNYIADLVIGIIVHGGTPLREIEFHCQNTEHPRLTWSKKESE